MFTAEEIEREKGYIRDRVVIDDRGCWNWQGSLINGYGNLGTKRLGQWSAHRLSFVVFKEIISPGLLVRHMCDNRRCVNPDHLVLGTYKENAQDVVDRGRHGSITHPEKVARGDRSGLRRHPERAARGDKNGARLHPEKLVRGENNKASKLTDKNVNDLLNRPVFHGCMVEWAKEFGVSDVAIANVIKRRTWKHVK